ncbi:exonuclease SbcCD subunit D [Salinactinospora qingdaonensis]|uniref:Nuclease SbcCD subunit D n=1 Tax=Salinactinospora qingdaonensis TaxID=702744 RepID=A0ABP7FBF7_9ACTN
MRLLHTSDWHLGRSFHRESLLDAQAAFIDHLIATIRSERVDVVLVSGDLYDRALPPVDAVRLFSEALRRIRDTGAKAVLISGNHDSMVRLSYATELIDASGVYLRSDPATVGTPVILNDEHGPVACYGIPYLEPELVRHEWKLTKRSHTAALNHAMDLVRADLATQPAGTRSVVLSHAFVRGGEPSDSERDIRVGGAADVPASVFDGVDYVALGHLHGRQRVAENVYYSGSPLAYSFSEEHQVKGSWLVELDAAGASEPVCVEAPVPRPIARLRGRIDDLLTEERWQRYTEHWLQITLTDPLRPAFPMDRLRERFPYALHLEFAPEGEVAQRETTWTQRTAERSEADLALDFVDWARGSPATPQERHLIDHALADLRARENAG